MSIRTENRNAGLAEVRARSLADARRPESAKVETPAPSRGALGAWAGWTARYTAWPWHQPRFLAAVCHAVNAPEDFEVPALVSGLPAGAEARRLREHVGLSVEVVAEKLQVPADMLTAHECGTAVETRVPETDINVRHHGNPSVRREWVVTRFVPDECLRNAHPTVASRLYSAMALTRSVGAHAPVSKPAPKPTPAPVVVVGAELLDEVLRAAEAMKLDPAGIPTSLLMARIARGELMSPTLRAWPSGHEVAGWLSVFPGLARRGSLLWTTGIADRLAESPPEAAIQFRDELGVGTAGMWRCLGTIAALIAARPDLAERVEAARVASERKAADADASHAEARLAAAQDAAQRAMVELDAAERG